MTKHFILLISFLSIYCLTNAQTIQAIDSKLDSLEVVKKALQIKIKTLQKDLYDTKMNIAGLNQEKIKLGGQPNDEVSAMKAYISSLGGILRDKPSSTGNIIVKIEPNEEVLVYRWQQNLYFKVNYAGKLGYINYSNIEPNEDIDGFLAEEKLKEKTIDDFVNTNLERLTKLYGEESAKKILNKEFFKGMTTGMVRECMGMPSKIEKAQKPDGMEETWTFGTQKIVFKSGQLISW